MHLARTTLAQAALVAALTGVFYSFGLVASPPHLTHDEIKFAFQANAIAQTGRDTNGRLLPLYFKEPGFAVGRDPICIYVMAAVLTVLPLSEWSIRFATVIVGAIGVGLVFILGRLLFRSGAAPWIAALILALSPTYYIHSRLALSVIYPVPFTILWLICLVVYLRDRRPRHARALGIVLGAGVYSYLAAAIMMPLYLVATVVALAVQRDRAGVRRVVASFALMMLPILIWQIIEPERYANILSAYRLYDAEQTAGAGKLQEMLSADGLRSRLDVWWETFNPSRLFFTGESSLQISTRQVGSLLTAVLVLLAVGMRRLLAAGTAVDWMLVFGLISAPLPAVLMADVEIRRWLVVLPFVAIIAASGAEQMLAPRRRARAAAVLLVLVMGLQFVVFTVDFFGPYRLRSSVWFGGNIREAAQRVLARTRHDMPGPVYVASDIPWVDAYWRFYAQVHNQEAVLNRTVYVHLASGAVPAAAAGAVMMAPVPDSSLSARLREAGWRVGDVIPDLDGHASLVIAVADGQ